jgi:hypothetical protein
MGCGYGGFPYKAMDFVKTHPLCTEADYPYTEASGGNVSSCKDPCVGAVTLTGVVQVPSEAAMLPALEQQVGLANHALPFMVALATPSALGDCRGRLLVVFILTPSTPLLHAQPSGMLITASLSLP